MFSTVKLLSKAPLGSSSTKVCPGIPKDLSIATIRKQSSLCEGFNLNHDAAISMILYHHPSLPRSPGSCPLLTVNTAPLSAVLPPTWMKKHDLTNKNTATKIKTMTMTAPLSAVLPPTCSVSCHCWWYFALYIYIM